MEFKLIYLWFWNYWTTIGSQGMCLPSNSLIAILNQPSQAKPSRSPTDKHSTPPWPNKWKEIPMFSLSGRKLPSTTEPIKYLKGCSRNLEPKELSIHPLHRLASQESVSAPEWWDWGPLSSSWQWIFHSKASTKSLIAASNFITWVGGC